MAIKTEWTKREAMEVYHGEPVEIITGFDSETQTPCLRWRPLDQSMQPTSLQASLLEIKYMVERHLEVTDA